MLEVNNVIIPELIFSGWDLPEAIEVFYYEDPETHSKTSSGFAVTYPRSKEGLMTEEWEKQKDELNLRSATLQDKNDPLGTLETLYYGLSNSSIEKDDQTITFGFVCDSSNTFLKPAFFE